MMPYVAIRERLKDDPTITALGAVLDRWPAEPRYVGDPNGTPEAFQDGFMLPCFYPAISGITEHPTEAWQGINDSWVQVHFFAPIQQVDLLDNMRNALFHALHRKRLPDVLDGYGWVTWAGDGVIRDSDPFPDTITDYARFRVNVRRETPVRDF
jgi:hypothetical protein